MRGRLCNASCTPGSRCPRYLQPMGFDVSGLTAYVNGEYVPGTAAAVSIFDHGFMYGDGVFEGMRVFDGGLFRARDHMARFVRSARAVGLAPPDPDEVLGI